MLEEFERLIKRETDLAKELEALRDSPAETPDGARISLQANAGLLSDLVPALEAGAEGIGLYRTEFTFMVRDAFPDEEAQTQVYGDVLAAFAPRPVTMRTLDVGGDKALPYFPVAEDNALARLAWHPTDARQPGNLSHPAPGDAAGQCQAREPAAALAHDQRVQGGGPRARIDETRIQRTGAGRTSRALNRRSASCSKCRQRFTRSLIWPNGWTSFRSGPTI